LGVKKGGGQSAGIRDSREPHKKKRRKARRLGEKQVQNGQFDKKGNKRKEWAPVSEAGKRWILKKGAVQL